MFERVLRVTRCVCVCDPSASTTTQYCIIIQPYQCRNTLECSCTIAGALKTLSNGQKMAKPIKLFEITDVVLKDPTSDVGASNRRHLVALHGGITSGKQL
jgi:hypothetical protein